MKKSTKPIQARRFCAISYLDRRTIISILQNKDKLVRNYAVICHDRDVDENGLPKETHCHLVILFNYPYKLQTVENWFKGWTDTDGKPVNTFVEVCTSPHGSYVYFTHKEHPQKVQYSEDEIVCKNRNEFKVDDFSCEDNAFIALDLVLKGETRYNIAKRIGRDFIYHYQSIMTLAHDISFECEMDGKRL